MKKGFYLETKERFRFNGVFWKPIMRVSRDDISIKEIHRINGPLCLDCVAEIAFTREVSKLGICPICKRKYKLEQKLEEARRLAYIRYKAKLDSKLKPISLDSPIQPIKDRKEDKEHWVEVRLGHSNDGRKIAVLYIGDKKRKSKAQAFVDLDNEQLRLDKSDRKPHEIVATLIAEFLNSKHKIEKK